MRMVLILFLFATTAAAQSGPTRCVDDVCFGNRITLEWSDKAYDFDLQAAVLYRFWGFRVYNVALYQEGELKSDWEDSPLGLVLHYHRTLDPEDFLESSRKLLSKNPSYAARGDESSLLQFQKYITQVKDGDRYGLLYEPEGRLTLFLNGKLKGTVEDPLFAKAYIGMWLGEHSVKEKNRDKLLRGLIDD